MQRARMKPATAKASPIITRDSVFAPAVTSNLSSARHFLPIGMNFRCSGWICAGQVEWHRAGGNRRIYGSSNGLKDGAQATGTRHRLSRPTSKVFSLARPSQFDSPMAMSGNPVRPRTNAEARTNHAASYFLCTETLYEPAWASGSQLMVFYSLPAPLHTLAVPIAIPQSHPHPRPQLPARSANPVVFDRAMLSAHHRSNLHQAAPIPTTHQPRPSP